MRLGTSSARRCLCDSREHYDSSARNAESGTSEDHLSCSIITCSSRALFLHSYSWKVFPASMKRNKITGKTGQHDDDADDDEMRNESCLSSLHLLCITSSLSSLRPNYCLQTRSTTTPLSKLNSPFHYTNASQGKTCVSTRRAVDWPATAAANAETIANGSRHKKAERIIPSFPKKCD